MFTHTALQGGPPEDLLDAAAVDGWIEGPTWASPLNSSQLTALLLLLSAARELCDLLPIRCLHVTVGIGIAMAHPATSMLP
jgi:hypothetical protein